MTQAEWNSEWASDILRWHERCCSWLEFLNDAECILDIRPESTLNESSWDLMRGWADQITRAHDLGDWLEYWMFECLFGTEPVAGKVVIGGKEYRVGDVEELLEVIAADKRLTRGV